MAEDVRYFKLGLFALGALGLVVTGILLLGAMDYFRLTVTIETYFVSESVKGLEVGAPVKFLGVGVGKVTEIKPAGLAYHRDEIIQALRARDWKRLGSSEFLNSILVRMEIVPSESFQEFEELRLDFFQTMVELGLRARLSQSGLAGPVFVDLEYLDPEIYPPPEVPWTPRYFYIPSAPGSLTEFKGAASAILTRLRRTDFSVVAERLDRGFEVLIELAEKIDVDEVRDDLIRLGEDLRYSGNRLREFLDDPRLEQSLKDFIETAAGAKEVFKREGGDLGSALAKIPQTVDRLDSITERTEKILGDGRIEEILEGMSRAAGSAPETMQNAEATTAELRRLVRELSRLTMTLNEDLQVVTENLRRITEDAEIITGELRDNPSRLILGKEPSRFDPAKSGNQEQKP